MTINNNVISKDLVLTTVELTTKEISKKIKEQINKLTKKRKITTTDGTMIDYEEVLGFRA